MDMHRHKTNTGWRIQNAFPETNGRDAGLVCTQHVTVRFEIAFASNFLAKRFQLTTLYEAPFNAMEHI